MYRYRSIYFDDPPQPDRALDIFPTARKAGPVGLFFVHGGGWFAGTRGVYHPIMRAFAHEGIECASVAYRLSPGSLWQQIDDVREGLRIYLEDRTARQLPPHVVMAGCSAGAHLALMAVLGEGGEPLWESVPGVSVQAPALSFVPWDEIFPQIWSTMQRVIGTSYEENPSLYERASPIRLVRKGMPPVLILHAEHEHMFPLEIAEQFQRTALAEGVEVMIKHYRHAEHGFFYALDRKSQKQAFADILAFVRSCSSGKISPSTPAHPRLNRIRISPANNANKHE